MEWLTVTKASIQQHSDSSFDDIEVGYRHGKRIDTGLVWFYILCVAFEQCKNSLRKTGLQ